MEIAVIILLVGVAILFLGWSFFRQWKMGSGKNCGGCNCSHNKEEPLQQIQIKQ